MTIDIEEAEEEKRDRLKKRHYSRRLLSTRSGRTQPLIILI